MCMLFIEIGGSGVRRMTQFFSRVLWRELHLNSTPHLLDLEGIPRALAALRGGHMKGKCIALIDPQSIEL